ncbi:putative signal transducing protein [Winogradskyella aurantiaca]|uniref:putative signal transducing protein n=1 Tax=Winogradskyella aurantiaca TaxID=2219558 RepID=UPI000E1DD734|nr:DUF2007 domain-containing protein [Winogradskyella aurantiaca]
MSDFNYIQIFSGSSIIVNRIKIELESVGISPIIKDEGESQRLAGYGSLSQGIQEIVVREDELEKAQIVLEQIQNELDLSTD